MAGMLTVLTPFSAYGDSMTYTTAGHTASKPKLVLQKRRVPVNNQVIAEDTISVVQATEDDNGVILTQKVMFTATVRRPVNGQATDVTAALAIFRDVIAGDEFGNVVNTQEPIV